MRVGVLLSGGKDSLFAAFLAGKEHELACLITLMPERQDSYMFHTPNIALAGLTAKAVGLPLVAVETRGEKEKELSDLEKAMKTAKEKFGIGGVVSGAIRSTYQRKRVDAICKKLRLEHISPLWHIDEEKYMGELIANNFEVIVVAVAAKGLGREWLGRTIGRKAVRELKELNRKFGISIVGEGGEYETFVKNCSLFRKGIEIVKSRVEMENECTGRLVIDETELV